MENYGVDQANTSIPMWFWLSIASGLLSLYKFVIQPLTHHPLRKIPRAHWSVAYPYVGSIWIKYRRYCGKNNATTYLAHQTHGEVVRLGYEELSINCIDNGVRTVYGKGWEKSDYYMRKYACYGVNNMFTAMHSTPHSHKKRSLAHIYSKSYLQNSEQLRRNSTYLLKERILPLLQSCSDMGQALDMYDLNKAFTMDFSSAYIFGLSRATNVIQDLQTRREVMHNYHLRHGGEWHRTEIPSWIHGWMKALHMPLVPPEATTANSWLERWTTQMCDSADDDLQSQFERNERVGSNPGDDPIVYRYFKRGMTEVRLKDPRTLPDVVTDGVGCQRSSLESMSKRELYSEMFDHLEAGHVTSTTSLTYLYWEMSRNLHMQDRLHAELTQKLTPRLMWPMFAKGHSPSLKFELPDAQQIDSLPYLDAIVKEALRVHAPIPGRQPRKSPDVEGGSSLGQFFGIPGGITVSAMAHSLHRNADVFPDPEVFDPDRWLTSDAERLQEMKKWFWPFGSGGRMCIGSNFALQEIKLFLAAIYSNWRTEIVDGEGMEKVDGQATRPKGNKLIIKFVHKNANKEATSG